MDAEQWNSLEQHASWLLAHSDQAGSQETVQGMRIQLRLWEYAQSQAWTSWAIILGTGFGRKRPVIREARWDRPADWHRAQVRSAHLLKRAISEPTVLLRDAEMSWDDLSPLMKRAARFPRFLPIKTDSAPAGKDQFGIEGYGSMAYLLIAWTGVGLDEWREVIDSISRLREALMEAIDERATGIAKFH
ncbi:MAG: hypothetical protein HYY16_05970 [Planctomycetes bacterium]|nr:hypothetical protein [Planctomycetota bacterium]